MRKSGFRKSAWEVEVYFLAEIVLLVWVDDNLLVGGRWEVEATGKILQEAFTIHDMGLTSGNNQTSAFRTRVYVGKSLWYIGRHLKSTYDIHEYSVNLFNSFSAKMDM